MSCSYTSSFYDGFRREIYSDYCHSSITFYEKKNAYHFQTYQVDITKVFYDFYA